MKRKHPLEYKHETATGHRYPESDHSERDRLPDGLAAFCFPNDLQFKHNPDNPPESTTHSFFITEKTGAKVYAVCLLLYEPIQETLASQLEELLEEWRADCVAGTDVEYLQHIQSQLAANQEQILQLRSGMVEGLSGAEMENILSDAEEKVAPVRERLKEMEHVAGGHTMSCSSTGCRAPRRWVDSVMGSPGCQLSYCCLMSRSVRRMYPLQWRHGE
ncbi:uDENN domain-containing protein [Chytriomyces sp. MP71]|nr:uDENN domain-containing protein [Chytriomyces sp. MP71]